MFELFVLGPGRERGKLCRRLGRRVGGGWCCLREAVEKVHLTGIAIGLGAVCFFGLLKWRTAVDYTNECVIELVKVTWPDREETTNSSMVVIVASLIFAGSLALFDYVWSQVTEIFLFSAS